MRLVVPSLNMRHVDREFVTGCPRAREGANCERRRTGFRTRKCAARCGTGAPLDRALHPSHLRGLQRSVTRVATPVLGTARYVLPRARRGRRRNDGAGVPEHHQPHRGRRRAGAHGHGDHLVHGQGVGRASQPRRRASRSRSGATSPGREFLATSSSSSVAPPSPRGSCKRSFTSPRRSDPTIRPPTSPDATRSSWKRCSRSDS